MIKIQDNKISLEDLFKKLLNNDIPDESDFIEYKKSLNSLSEDLWKTFSAFGNGYGGIIVCGVEERRNKKGATVDYEITGVNNSHKQEEDFWSKIRSSAKFKSLSWLNNDSFVKKEINDKILLFIDVKESSPEEKPVNIGSSIAESYLRHGTHDDRMTSDELRTFLLDTSLNMDNKVLKKYGIDELNEESINEYRTWLLKDSKLKHLAVEVDNEKFLEKIGAIVKDVQTGDVGITYGALLFLGNRSAITQVFSSFQLDYIDKSDVSNKRYVRRITSLIDVENIFQFYIRVMDIIRNAPQPFVLDDNQIRNEGNDSFIVALREALVNCLMHANYFLSNKHILIEKRMNNYMFSNPGTMLVSSESFFTRTESISRNSELSRFFVMMGAGERVGTGGTVIKDIAINNNLKFPELDRKEFETNITIWEVDYTDTLSDSDLDSKDKAILKVITKNIILSRHDIEIKTNFTQKEVQSRLKKLRDKNYVEMSGSGRSIKYTLPVDDEQIIALSQKNTDIIRKALNSKNK